MLLELKWLANATYFAIRRPRMARQKLNVVNEYTATWDSYSKYLDSCETLEEWLRIKGAEDIPQFYNVSGALKFEDFNVGAFNQRKIVAALRENFPAAKSITEFGCGVGRNLLYIKQQMPHLQCYGYELCRPGVEIARAAAKKFGLDVSYSQLDYVAGSESDYVFPKTDVAFTMYSLEQLPETNKIAIENILCHTHYGSIHIEPVPENYPLTYRGIIGRLDHWKANYLRNFERNITSLGLDEIKREYLNSAHNPLMFPTLYVLKGHPRRC